MAVRRGKRTTIKNMQHEHVSQSETWRFAWTKERLAGEKKVFKNSLNGSSVNNRIKNLLCRCILWKNKSVHWVPHWPGQSGNIQDFVQCCHLVGKDCKWIQKNWLKSNGMNWRDSLSPGVDAGQALKMSLKWRSSLLIGKPLL